MAKQCEKCNRITRLSAMGSGALHLQLQLAYLRTIPPPVGMAGWVNASTWVSHGLPHNGTLVAELVEAKFAMVHSKSRLTQATFSSLSFASSLSQLGHSKFIVGFGAKGLGLSQAYEETLPNGSGLLALHTGRCLEVAR